MPDPLSDRLPGRRTGARPPRARAARLPAALVALLLLAPACSTGDPASDPAADQATRQEPAGAAGMAAPSRTATPRPRARALSTTVRLGEVVGRVPDGRRHATLSAVRGVVDAWIDRAYVGGSWPRSDYSRAFAGFTPGAERQARRDLKLTTNSGVSARISGVRVQHREVTMDVLATGQQVRAVTARVRLAYRTTGAVQRRFAVRGRLYLTRQSGRWRVFGYDLAKGAR